MLSEISLLLKFSNSLTKTDVGDSQQKRLGMTALFIKPPKFAILKRCYET